MKNLFSEKWYVRRLRGLALVSFLTLTMGLLSSCTRGVPSKIYLSIPTSIQSDIGKSSTTKQLHFGFVNVHVPGLPEPIVRKYDYDKDQLDNTKTVLAEVDNVPKVTNITVQFLGVYEDQNESMDFAYGSKTNVDSSLGGEIRVGITAQLVPAGKQAKISGQYVTSVTSGIGHGPTDRVLMEYMPNDGTPPMLLLKSEMFDGWFNLMHFTTHNFRFRFQSSGEVLPNMSLADLDTRVSSNPVDLLKIVTPTEVWRDESCTSCSPRKMEEMDFYIGFFGPARTSITGPAKACYVNSVSTYTDLYLESSLTTNVFWDANSPVDTSTSIGVSNGGAEDGVSCVSGYTEYQNKIVVDALSFEYDFHSAVPVFGPFRKASFSFTDSNCDRDGFAAGCYNGTVAEVKAALIPGIVSSGAITGLSLFTRVEATCGDHECTSDVREKAGDGYRCNEMSAKGFTKIRDFVAADVSGNMVSHSFTAPLNSGEELSTIFCPFRVTATGVLEYFNSAIRVHGIGMFGGGGSGPSPTMTLINADITYLDSVITFGRSGATASFIDGSGYMQIVGPGVVRWDHDPSTGAPLGILIEETRTNKILYSEVLTDSNWILTGGGSVTEDIGSPMAPTNTTAVDRIDDPSTGATEYLKQLFTVPQDSSPYVASVFFAKTTSDTNYKALEIEIGTTSIITCKIIVDTNGSGSLTSSTGCVDYGLEDYGPNFIRVWARLDNNNITGNTTLSYSIYPAYNSTGNLTESTTATGMASVWGAQLENDYSMSSYIPSGATAGQRLADRLNIASLGGWFDTTQGSLVIYADHRQHGMDPSSPGYLLYSYTNASSYSTIKFDSNDVEGEIYAGGPVADLLAGAWGPYLFKGFGLAWSANSFSFSRNGNTALNDNTGSVPSMNQMEIGARGNGIDVLNGHIYRLDYYNYRLPDNDLQNVSYIGP